MIQFDGLSGAAAGHDFLAGLTKDGAGTSRAFKQRLPHYVKDEIKN